MSGNTQKIGVSTATIVGINAMIGSSIFSAPAVMAANVGPAGILAYVFVVISVWFLGQSLARVAYLFPQEGSFYTYAKQWGGHAMGVAATSSYFVGMIIAMGILTQMAASYLHFFLPNVSTYTIGAVSLAVLVVFNMFGVQLSKLGQHVLILCTLFPLIAITALCLTKADLANLTPFAPYGFGNVLKATRVVIFSFFGFECATALFNVVKDPEKNVPKALTYSILIVGIIYTIFIGSIIISTPLEYFTSPDVPLTGILAQQFPTHGWLINIINLAIASSILGTIHSMLWASSSLCSFLLKKIALPFRTIGNLSETASAVLLAGVAIFGTYSTITNPFLFFYITSACVVFAYISSIITLLTIKKEWQSRQNVKTMMGLTTALIIFVFAVEGIIQEISNIW